VSNFRLTTFRLPASMILDMEDGVKKGNFASRTEYVTLALTEFLDKEKQEMRASNQPISILEHSGDFYFHAVSVAIAMDYQQPKYAVRNFINRRIEQITGSTVFVETSEIGNLRVSDLATVAITYANASSVFLNAEALALFVDYSEAKNSPYFKKWFAQFNHKYFKKETKDLQLAVNNTSLTSNDSLAMFESLNTQLSYAINIVKLQEERSQAQDKRISDLEIANRMHSIDRHQAYEVKRQISQLAYMIAEIEGSDKPKRETFIKLWTTFNDTFGIPSYKDLPKERYVEALELLTSWRERFNQELAVL